MLIFSPRGQLQRERQPPKVSQIGVRPQRFCQIIDLLPWLYFFAVGSDFFVKYILLGVDLRSAFHFYRTSPENGILTG